ncbi:MAG: DNA replication/repair protein RecF [Gammaproteobacteria bacterium]|nr:DNA replication/repair protein RecF [Gammaproteobacteria bacterium]MXY56333.1 DNA replication/repair protein RecF [Gammaproteobacteria bacterium]MYK47728.1 DNA replication/repair protein RecF [Gammaproteobacteria bacterium]
MIVERIDIGNVRNIDSARLHLHPRANLLAGPNGAGKTSALEALHLVVRGRSFRTTRADQIIRHGEEKMAVAALLADERLGSVRLGYARERRGRLELRRDGQLVRQTSRVASLLPIQLLLPDLPELVFGGPAGRRQWLDWGVFHVEQDYARVLGGYLRALRQRNVVLRAADLKTLPVWTEQVAELGEAVAEARGRYFDRVMAQVAVSLATLDPDLEVECEYLPGWKADSFAEVLGQQVDRDVKLGTTLSGPHRADVRITCGSESAAQVLSRGQGKAVASALHMGQAKDLAVAGKRSLFLIDDLGAELDEEHNERYYRQLEDMDCQIVATSTEGAIGEILMGFGGGRMFHVKQGHFE